MRWFYVVNVDQSRGAQYQPSGRLCAWRISDSLALQLIQCVEDDLRGAFDFRQQGANLVFVVGVVGVDSFRAEIVEVLVRLLQPFIDRRATVFHLAFALVPVTETAVRVVEDVGGIELHVAEEHLVDACEPDQMIGLGEVEDFVRLERHAALEQVSAYFRRIYKHMEDALVAGLRLVLCRVHVVDRLIQRGRHLLEGRRLLLSERRELLHRRADVRERIANLARLLFRRINVFRVLREGLIHRVELPAEVLDLVLNRRELGAYLLD